MKCDKHQDTVTEHQILENVYWLGARLCEHTSILNVTDSPGACASSRQVVRHHSPYDSY